MLRLPAATESPSIRVSHVSLGNAEGDYNTVIEYLMSIDADLLSFQELTPDWNQHLTEKLSREFHFIHTITRLDQYGMGLFSKRPLLDVDTLYYESIPSLAATIDLGDRQVCRVISCQVIPPVNQTAFSRIDRHFSFLTQYMQAHAGHTMVMGDFHLPPWSAEVQRFRTNSQLQDGRRDIHSRSLDGSMLLPRIPVEHILFSDGLECTSFSEIGTPEVGRLGITGIYQLHYEEMVQ
jgi:endonuclease/exonuclease/phosphatase (EEP) superfamily protein YafD